MKMQLTCLTVLISLTAIPSAAQTANEIADQYIHEWMIGHANRDPEALLKLYSKDAVLLPGYHRAPYLGLDAIGTFFNGLFRNSGSNLEIANQIVRQEGEIVYGAGQWSEEVLGESGSRVVNGMFLYILKKEGNEWKAVAETWNHDRN